MGRSSIEFKFDMGRPEYLAHMARYNMSSAKSVKNDKEKFQNYYATHDLEMYQDRDEKKKFIIPCEMADLYCLMMAAMKSSVTYDERKKDYTFDDVITHYKQMVKWLDENLPIPILDFIKTTPEYHNILCIINYLPCILERMSALLNLAFGAADNLTKNTFDYILESLDGAYEGYFWKLAQQENFIERITEDKDFYDTIFGKNTDTSYTRNHYSLDFVLADLLKKLDRSNWPEGVKATVEAKLAEWEEQYRGKNNMDKRVKNEYLKWLSQQEWHILNKPVSNPVHPTLKVDEASIKESIASHNIKYSEAPWETNPVLHDATVDVKSDEDAEAIIEEAVASRSTKYARASWDISREIFKIKAVLQRDLDLHIVIKLLDCIDDIDIFTLKFEQQYAAILSTSVSATIEKVLCLNLSEGKQELLKSFLESMFDALYDSESLVSQYELQSYVYDIVDGSVDIDTCVEEIYADVFLDVQLHKRERFNKNEYRRLHKQMENLVANELRAVLVKETK